MQRSLPAHSLDVIAGEVRGGRTARIQCEMLVIEIDVRIVKVRVVLPVLLVGRVVLVRVLSG